MNNQKPRMLIIIRAGQSSIHGSWIYATAGFADVAISVYDETDFSHAFVKYIHRSAGGKFQGISKFFDAHPSLLNEYDYFWLIDEDIFVPLESLRTVLELLFAFPFNLSAPGLSYYSYFTWPLTAANARFIFRCTNFVEIMMPIMSREFIEEAMPAFNENFSGHGHEWLWQRMLSQKTEYAAIFDSAPVSHTRAVGTGSAATSSPNGGPSLAEQRTSFLSRFSLDMAIPFRNYFAVTREKPIRTVFHDDFLQVALGGYQKMQGLKTQNFLRCIDYLIQTERPITPKEEIEESASVKMVEARLRDGFLLNESY